MPVLNGRFLRANDMRQARICFGQFGAGLPRRVALQLARRAGAVAFGARLRGAVHFPQAPADRERDRHERQDRENAQRRHHAVAQEVLLLRHRERFLFGRRLQRLTEKLAQVRPIVPPFRQLGRQDFAPRPLDEAEPEKNPAQQCGEHEPHDEIEPTQQPHHEHEHRDQREHAHHDRPNRARGALILGGVRARRIARIKRIVIVAHQGHPAVAS